MRLKFLNIFLGIFFVLMGCSKETVQAQSKAVNPKSRPNIVIIMADDLDSKQLSCYGGKNLKTHNIDKLAESGMKFTNMIASEAMCVPTRASLLTGLYPARHGAFQNHKPVSEGVKSIAHYLKDLNYRVGVTGKNHVVNIKEVFPGDIIPGFEPNCIKKTDEYFLDSLENYIQQPDPYCLFIMSINPHVPWTAGDRSEFDKDKLILPANWIDTDVTRRNFVAFLAEVRRLDDQVGDVMKILKKKGQLENTIVVFLGEQGPQFPGGKWTLWDYGQRSSMIVRWPGVVKPKTTSDALVQYEDILPTLISAVGGKSIPTLDGINFENVLRGESDSDRDYAYGIHNNIPSGTAYPMRSIRDKKYKLIWNMLPNSKYFVKMMNPEGKGLYTSWVQEAKTNPKAANLVNRVTTRPEFQFYDLTKDPDELENLANIPKYAKDVELYKSKLQSWMKQQGDKGVAMDIEYGE